MHYRKKKKILKCILFHEAFSTSAITATRSLIQAEEEHSTHLNHGNYLKKPTKWSKIAALTLITILSLMIASEK